MPSAGMAHLCFTLSPIREQANLDLLKWQLKISKCVARPHEALAPNWHNDVVPSKVNQSFSVDSRAETSALPVNEKCCEVGL